MGVKDNNTVSIRCCNFGINERIKVEVKIINNIDSAANLYLEEHKNFETPYNFSVSKAFYRRMNF